VSGQIPKIYSEDLGGDLPPKDVNIKPRIFYYDENFTDEALRIGSQVRTTIPAFKFYNQDVDDGKSLLFNNEAGNGLRQRYYMQDIAIREDGRIFHCWVNYNEIQIANVDLRATYRVGNVLYELKEISQYQPGKSTHFELIPLKKTKILPTQSMTGVSFPNPKLNKTTNDGTLQKMFKYVASSRFTQPIEFDSIIDSSYELLRIDTSSRVTTNELPSAYEGKVFDIDKFSISNTATLTPSINRTINGEASFVMTGIQQIRIKLVDNDWVILSDSNSSKSLVQNTYTTDQGIPETDDISFMNSAANAIFTLPSAPAKNKFRHVINIGTTAGSIIAFGGGTINGKAVVNLELEESAELLHLGSNIWRLS